MKIRKLLLSETASLYENHMKRDFPPSELKPLAIITAAMESGIYDIYGYFKEEAMVAYACIQTAPDLPYALLDYYAVVPSYRNAGIGKAFLRLLTQNIDADGFIIEAENPRYAADEGERLLRLRRISFYEICGALPTRVAGELFTTQFSVLYLPIKGEIPSDRAVLKGIHEMYRSRLPEDLYLEYVKYELKEA